LKYNPKEARAGSFHNRIIQDYGGTSKNPFSIEDEHYENGSRP
jgi:hypothetical protein